MSPRYQQEEFLEVIDAGKGDHWIGTHTVTRYVGCTMETANRHLLAAAHDGEIDVYDPKESTEVDPETINDDTSRLLGFRRPPDDPESAPDYLDTGFKRL